MTDTVVLDLEAATRLCEQAALRHGAGPGMARLLARASVDAEAEGQASVGLSHLFDYLEALDAGRIDGAAVPRLTRPAPAFIHCDAGGGIAHAGFDAAFVDLLSTARSLGIGAFVQSNAFTCGALGWFAARLADEGLLAIAATNGPPLLAGSGGTRPVFCTNPMAFAAPVAGGPPLLIDQASSATAFVSIRQAANEGRSIPPGWALDGEGKPTTDPHEAMKGALLAFGGPRGANVALMVEVLSAGLSGANWSLEAPPFGTGSEGPGTGLFVLAIDPALLAPDFSERLGAHLRLLSDDHGIHIPGPAKAAARSRSQRDGIRVPKALVEKLRG